MHLQLADGNPAFNQNSISNHVYIPSKGVFVREDLGDNMPFSEWTQTLSAEGYTLEQIAELAGKRRERKTAKQEAKAERKQTKATSKADKRTAKQERKATRTRLNPEDKAGVIGKIIGGAIPIVGALTTKATGQAIPQQPPEQESEPVSGKFSKPQSTDTTTESDDKIFGLPKKVVYIGGAVLLAGIAFLVIKSKEKK